MSKAAASGREYPKTLGRIEGHGRRGKPLTADYVLEYRNSQLAALLLLTIALKLKEISYIHAEAYAAGELKHGPLALVDADMPVIAVAPNDELLEKLKSNLQEVRARGGELYVFSVKGTGVRASNTTKIRMPEVGETTSPILYTVPLQLLAYYVALAKGTDVDQPRNLAKSVTVE